ncbi:MAG TPA: hypothetical protein VHX38_04930 [Pseudonocardiaceae bacterium]|jgi:hypothetical protein|nr:hypothetical protein [Pseudonocardiaceae bacterium]
MEAQMFAIVLADDDTKVFSYGIDTGEDAVTFRRDPSSGRTIFSVHDDAYRALSLAERLCGGAAELQLLRYPSITPLVDGGEHNELPAGSTSRVPAGFGIEDAEDRDGEDRDDEDC